MTPIFSLTLLAFAVLNGAGAHPGHSAKQEAAERYAFMKRNPASVRSCASNLSRRGHVAQSLVRRQQFAESARAKQGLPGISRRDFAEYNVSHASDKDFTFGDDELDFFKDNSTCILQPEVTQGPYYVDGELIRSNIVEDQEGVPVYLEVQLIDTSSCEPVPAVFMDMWHCNSTGVYSGVSASGNGNDEDTTNIDNTFLRGIQQTDINGVAQFETVFPGHYTGRASHIHILAHAANETTVRTNGTLLGGNFTTHAVHVGQLFFDQDLISQVEGTAPYNTNTQDTTLNSDDDILASEADDMDPFVQYILLGDSVSDGLLAWISIGIDPSADNEVTAAATHYDGYGVANSDTGMGGGAPSGGAMPSGDTPTGMPSKSAAPSAGSGV
ncbi:extracellular dioxygenase [Polychaeton citri CBS 116435]|uniref:Extracellular dioxygenase n=1 Tax=Polychaeton citri CBS 116435 TaxID=1314669 RepID=A0A9P4Q3U5_9PEZI|nr:extracellular dioxygenase [Polychaeton citri CBS 116435]